MVFVTAGEGGGSGASACSATGREPKRPSERSRSYMTMAPAVARLSEKAAGMRTRCWQRAASSGDSVPRSGPST